MRIPLAHGSVSVGAGFFLGFVDYYNAWRVRACFR
jgi:hypothetical protein